MGKYPIKLITRGEKMKKITLSKRGFFVEGTADVTPWGGGRASIPMKGFFVEHLKDIKENINDNGFGVEKINGAICEVFDDFGKCKEYRRQIVVGDVKDFVFDNHYENN